MPAACAVNAVTIPVGLRENFATPNVPPPNASVQAFDVVVVNDAPSLLDCPLQAVADALAHLGGEVLPAGVSVLTRDHELRVTLRQRQVDIRQMRARTRDRTVVTRGDVEIGRASCRERV